MAKWPTQTKWPGGSVFPVGSSPSQILASSTSSTLVEQWRADASDITVATGVSSWRGKVALTVWAQGTGAAQPTYNATDALFNGQPSLTFNGSSHEMTASIAAPAPGTTARFYWLIARNIAMALPAFILSGSGAASHIIYRQGADAADQMGQFNTTKVNASSNFTAGAARLVQVYFSNSTSDFVKIGGTAPSTGSNAGNSSAASMVLGSSGAANFGNFAIAELLVCNGLPSVQERLDLQSYAVSRYGSSVIA